MTDELDRDLQARLQGAAERIGSKTDRLEEVQLAGNRRQDRRRVVASGAAATAFVVALGASLFAVASFGEADTVMVSQPANGGDDSASGSAVSEQSETTDGPVDDGASPTDPRASETTTGSAADDGADGPEPETDTTGPVSTGTRPTIPDGTTGTILPGGDTTIPTTTEGVVGSETTAGPDGNPFGLTTIPLPGGLPSWEYTYVDLVVQQWIDGADDCIRVYTPVELDPAAPIQTIARQGNYEVCQRGATAEGDWYVETDELPQMVFLLYALPPLDPAAVWVSNGAGGQVDGFVDREYWGVEVLESFEPTTLHILRLNGQEETIDLPSAAGDGTALRFYIGRPMALG